MKNLTTNRSALSKESMDVIENITNDENSSFDIYKTENTQSDVPEEYIRAYDKNTGKDNKSQEIDLLWQTFKSAQFNGSSPLLWGIGGFCLGVIATLLVLALTGTFSSQALSNKEMKAAITTDNAIETLENEQNTNSENEDIAENSENIQSIGTDATENATVNLAGSQKYVIKDGDTVEAIIVHFYGAYTPERAQAIMKANNLNNLDKISIGQVLIIPAEN